MSPSELKYHIESRGNDPHFFDRSTMRFFGDTMGNYGVRRATVNVATRYESGRPVEFESVDCWELYRKHATRKGCTGSAYFRRDTFARVFPTEI